MNKKAVRKIEIEDKKVFTDAVGYVFGYRHEMSLEYKKIDDMYMEVSMPVHDGEELNRFMNFEFC